MILGTDPCVGKHEHAPPVADYYMTNMDWHIWLNVSVYGVDLDILRKGVHLYI